MQLLTLSHENLRLSKWPELYYFSHILSSAVTRYLILNKQNYIKMVLRNIQHAILGDGWYDESGTCYVLTKPNRSKPTPCSLMVSCFVSYLFLCDEPAKKVYCECIRWHLLDENSHISSQEDVQAQHFVDTWSFACNVLLPQTNHRWQLPEETTFCLRMFSVRKLNELLLLLWLLPHYKMPNEAFTGQPFSPCSWQNQGDFTVLFSNQRCLLWFKHESCSLSL